MTSDIFSFWKQIGASEKIHPADAPVFERVGKKGHGLNLKCLPAPMRGALKDAKIVLLFLSPGLDKRDLKDAGLKVEQERYVQTRTGHATYSRETPGYTWFKSRTRFLELEEIDSNTIDQNVAVLNIGAYHSTSFVDYPLLAALPSSRVSLDWAQQILFPQAIKGERVVICLRSAHFWGLEKGKHWGKLFAPAATRGGHLLKSNSSHKKMHRNIIDAVESVLT